MHACAKSDSVPVRSSAVFLRWSGDRREHPAARRPPRTAVAFPRAIFPGVLIAPRHGWATKPDRVNSAGRGRSSGPAEWDGPAVDAAVALARSRLGYQAVMSVVDLKSAVGSHSPGGVRQLLVTGLRGVGAEPMAIVA